MATEQTNPALQSKSHKNKKENLRLTLDDLEKVAKSLVNIEEDPLNSVNSKEDVIKVIEHCVDFLKSGFNGEYIPKEGDLQKFELIRESNVHPATEMYSQDIAECMVRLNFGEFYKAVLLYCNGFDSHRDEEHSAIFENAMAAMWNFSYSSKLLCTHLAENQIVEILLNDLKKTLTMTRSNVDTLQVIYKEQEKPYKCIRRFYLANIAQLHNIIFGDPECKPIYQKSDASQILKPFVSYDDPKIQAGSSFTLARIIDEQQAELLADAGCFNFVAKEMESVLEGWSEHDFSYKALAEGLSYLACYDNNKLRVLESGVLSSLIKMMNDGETENQLAAIDCVWKLAFLEECRVQLDKDNDCTAALETLTESFDADVKSQAEMALERIHGTIGKKEEAQEKDDKSTKKHIFISYCHQNANIVHEIADLLKKEMPIWIDKDDLKGDLKMCISKAIEESLAMVIFISEKYRDSNMCRREVNYADHWNIPIIPVMIQRHYKADSWLGFTISSEYYVNYDGKFSEEEAFNNLIKQLHNATKVEETSKEELVDVVDEPGHYVSDKTEDEPKNDGKNEEFYQWAEERGLSRQTADKLLQEDLIAIETLSDLTESEIQELGLNMGQRKKLTQAVAQYQTGSGKNQSKSSKTCVII